MKQYLPLLGLVCELSSSLLENWYCEDSVVHSHTINGIYLKYEIQSTILNHHLKASYFGSNMM